MNKDLNKNKRVFFEEYSQENNSIIKKVDIINQIKDVYDPEIPVNIYDLGLIYQININDKNEVQITMSLTSPNCPVAESLPQNVAQKVKNVIGMKNLSLYLTFEPPWDQNMMSEDAKLALDIT